MYKYLLALALLFSSAAGAQTNLDSLFALWQDPSQSDSIRSECFNKYIFHGFIFSNPDSAFVLAEQLKAFGTEKKYRKAEAMGLYDQGMTRYVKGNADESLGYLHSSYAIMKEIGSDRGMLVTLSGLGMAHYSLSNYPKALDYMSQALTIFDRVDDKTGMPDLVNAIGTIYATQGDLLKALHYYNLSLKINKDIGDDRGIAFALSNIGASHQRQQNFPKALGYFEQALEVHKRMENQPGVALVLGNIGTLHTEQGNYRESLQYYQQALEIYQTLDNGIGTANVLSKIGFNYKQQGFYSEAMEYYKRALGILEEVDDKMSLAGVQGSIGEVYIQLEQNAQAIVFCKQSLALSEEIGILEEQKTACLCLYVAYKAMGNEGGALRALEKLRNVEGSLNTEEIALELQKMEFEKKTLADSLGTIEEARLVEEGHREEVRRKNQTRNLLAGGGLLLVLLAGGLFGRVRFIRKSKSILQSEKDRSENLLLNILPAEIAEELKANGETEAQMIENATVLFTDFKGFTAMSGMLSPKDLVRDLNICFSEFDRIIGEHGIEKIKTIGDAYMAAGGLPTPNQTHASDVVQAAFKMRDFVEAGKAKKMEAGLPYFEIRIGIHTGPVVAGIVGVKKFQYDIWGDTVNTASRMESSGAVGKVNISDATYALVKDNPGLSFESRGKIAAKGKGDLEMWFVDTAS